MGRGARPPRVSRQPERMPVNARLVELCRAGTDPAVTRALEEARSPFGQVMKLARQNIDWDQVADITSKLTEARAAE